MNIIFLGAPGSGKGTVANQLIDKYNYSFLSTGDIFRFLVNQNSDLANEIKTIIASGGLISDDLTNQVLKGALVKLNEKEKEKIIFDGYPRTIDQAKYLQNLVLVDKVVLLEVDEKKLLKRITGRRICPKCKRIYNIYSKDSKPKVDNFCDYDNEILIARKDDELKTAKHRINVYNSQTKPLINFYKKQNLLVKVDGSMDSIDSIVKEVVKVCGIK